MGFSITHCTCGHGKPEVSTLGEPVERAVLLLNSRPLCAFKFQLQLVLQRRLARVVHNSYSALILWRSVTYMISLPCRMSSTSAELSRRLFHILRVFETIQIYLPPLSYFRFAMLTLVPASATAYLSRKTQIGG